MKVYFSPSAQSVTLAMLSAISLMRLSRGFTSITVRQSVSSASAVFAGRNFSQSSKPLFMSTDTELATDSKTKISFPKRVKTVDVQDASDETISIKGWVRTVRKQKTLAFVEVNDGSSLSGIQCVLSFDVIDEKSKKGKRFQFFVYFGELRLRVVSSSSVCFTSLIGRYWKTLNRCVS